MYNGIPFLKRIVWWKLERINRYKFHEVVFSTEMATYAILLDSVKYNQRKVKYCIIFKIFKVNENWIFLSVIGFLKKVTSHYLSIVTFHHMQKSSAAIIKIDCRNRSLSFRNTRYWLYIIILEAEYKVNRRTQSH